MDKKVAVVVGSDHAGFELKSQVAKHLSQAGYAVEDLGCFNQEACDYPDFAQLVGEAVGQGTADFGVLVCGSGVGASVAANKVPGVRAAICHDTFSARQGREDDDTNVLCLGGRVIGQSLAMEVVDAFVKAKFSGADRHVRRLNKVLAIESKYMSKPPA